MSFDRLHTPLNALSSEPSPLVEARFIPRQYEPNYPYPLLVHFHARGAERGSAREGDACAFMAELCRSGSTRTGAGDQVAIVWPDMVGVRSLSSRAASGRVLTRRYRRRTSFDEHFSEPSRSRSNVWRSPSSSRFCRRGGCFTRTPSGSSWWGAAREPRWHTGSR